MILGAYGHLSDKIVKIHNKPSFNLTKWLWQQQQDVHKTFIENNKPDARTSLKAKSDEQKTDFVK